jgi:hypothetical protein
VLLACVGSDVRMMEELVEGAIAAARRPTLEVLLQPLSVPAVAQITGARDSSEAIDRYLVVGGFPLLAARWPRGASMHDPDTTAIVGDAAFVGSYWTRNNENEVDLVGGNGLQPTEIAFVGSVKWHERDRFTVQERRALVEHRAAVPGAADARIVIVSHTGIDDDVKADLVLGPDEIVAAGA